MLLSKFKVKLIAPVVSVLIFSAAGIVSAQVGGSQSAPSSVEPNRFYFCVIVTNGVAPQRTFASSVITSKLPHHANGPISRGFASFVKQQYSSTVGSEATCFANRTFTTTQDSRDQWIEKENRSRRAFGPNMPLVLETGWTGL